MQSLTTKHHNQVTVLFVHYGEEWIRGSERCLLDLLVHLDRDHYQPIVWCNCKTLAKEVQRLDVLVIHSDFHPQLSMKKFFSGIKAFYNLIKQGISLVDTYKIGLIHANSGAPNQWLNFVARARNIPLIAHLHAYYPLRERILLGLHHVSFVVGVSQPIIKQLSDDGVPLCRSCVIPNGIDVKKQDHKQPINIRQMLNLEPGDFLITSIGSLIQRKGLDLIIESFSHLIDQGVSAKLAIIGSGPEKHNLQKLIRIHDLENRIFMLGERHDVPRLLRGGIDLFVSASRQEAYGLVLAEASLAKLPVVASSVGGIPSVVIDGKTGLLVPAESVPALTNAMYKLFMSPKMRFQMGQAGHKHINKHFSILRNVREFEHLYSLVLNNPTMRMQWNSHWRIFQSASNAFRKIFDIGINKLSRESTS